MCGIHLINYYRYHLLVFCLFGLNSPNKTLAKSAPGQMTPLHQAVIQGDKKAVQSLLQEGAKVDSKDQKENTPLHHAALHNHTDIIKLLLAKGAYIHTRDHLGRTPLHKAATHGQLESVRMLIDHGAKVNKVGHAGHTPLWCAVSTGQLDVVKLLLREQAKPNKKTKDGTTPLHIATTGLFELTQLLHKAVGEVTAKNKLLERAPDRSSETIVLAMVQCLIEKGAKVNTQDAKGDTPLLRAVSKKYIDVAKLLIKHGAELNTTNKEGQRPLHQAAINGDITTAQLLIEEGAIINLEPSDLVTPLQVAIVNKQPKMAAFLLDKGAHILWGNPSPIRLLLDSKYKAAMQPFILHVLDLGPNSNREDDAFDWILRHIIADRNLAVLKLALQQKKIDANFRAHDETILGLATSWGHIETVKLLIEHGTDVNMPVHARSKTRGKMPLHHAARLGLVEIAELLIKHGADINAKSGRGNTPLKYALKHRHKDMIQFLKKHGAVTE